MIGYLAAVIVAMGMTLQQGTYMKSEQPIVDRDPNQMCLEVEREILIQVGQGLIDPEKGGEIIERCFEIFVGSK